METPSCDPPRSKQPPSVGGNSEQHSVGSLRTTDTVGRAPLGFFPAEGPRPCPANRVERRASPVSCLSDGVLRPV